MKGLSKYDSYDHANIDEFGKDIPNITIICIKFGFQYLYSILVYPNSVYFITRGKATFCHNQNYHSQSCYKIDMEIVRGFLLWKVLRRVHRRKGSC